MSDVLWTFPGKIGDAILQFGVMRGWLDATGKGADVQISEIVEPIGKILEIQPGVESVKVATNRITSYHMGGQPWDFGYKADELNGYSGVYHCGLRSFPTTQITKFTRDALGLEDVVSDQALEKPCLQVPAIAGLGERRLLIHPRRVGQHGGDPLFWSVMRRLLDQGLRERFGSLVVVGTREERLDAQARLGLRTSFADGGDWLALAQYVQGAALLIDAGTGVAPLAAALGVPCIRIHDPIGNHPKEIWSNPQPNQLNYDETQEAADIDAFIKRFCQ